MIQLKKKKIIFMNTNKKLLSSSSQTNTSGGKITHKLLHRISYVHIKSALDVQKAFLEYCVREFFEVLSLTSELTGDCKPKCRVVKEMGI